MRLSRVHVDEPLAPDSPVTLRGAAANHVKRVLRLAPGDELILFDGRGGEYDARIGTLRKESVLVAVGRHHAVERESPLDVTLAQGVSRGERMDLVVQKATELGVRRIVPILTERTMVRLDEMQGSSKRRHWQAVAIAACEQCGRNRVPEIAATETLAAFLSLSERSVSSRQPIVSSPQPSATRVVLSPGAGLKVRDLEAPGAAMIVLIGPEGGLSESERRAALDAGFRALSLGPRVLRTETAALAALAALQQHLGDL